MKIKLAVAISLALLAGCNRQPATSGQTTTAPAPVLEPSAPAPASDTINQPIPQQDLGASLALVGPPRYNAKDDTVVFDVQVSNSGKSPLVSAGTHPVQLGVTLAGPEGVDTAPGNREFVRAKLPLIVAGQQAQVTVNAPAQPALGLQIKAELVQEGVAWFGRKYGHPVLDVGTFQRCGNAAATLCDSAGKPLNPVQ